jgi:hypothetical protein
MGSWKMAGWNVPDSVPSTLKGNGTHELLRKIFVEMYSRLSDEMKADMLTKFKDEMGWVEGILQENEWLKKIGTIMPNHLFVRPKGVL